MYPLTTFIYLKHIKPPVSSLLLNTHLTFTVFLSFAFTMLLLVVIHAFLDRKLFTSEITYSFQISIWTCRCFLEYLSLSCVRINLRTVFLLDLISFVFHYDPNDPCVSSLFIFSFDEWIVYYKNIHIVRSI